MTLSCERHCPIMVFTHYKQVPSHSPKRLRYFVPFRCTRELASNRFVMLYVSAIVDVLYLACVYTDLILGDGSCSKSLISSLWHMRITGISLTTAVGPPFLQPTSQTDPSTLFRMGCCSVQTCMYFLMPIMYQSIRTYYQLDPQVFIANIYIG